MGRAKLKMELIQNEKSRNLTFKRRKEGLIRKMQEFTTLCDVKACMIIYGPKQENGPVKPEVWPPNPGPIIDIYKATSKNKAFGLNEFFHGRKKKMEDKYPTHLDASMKKWTQGQLRQLAANLGNKVESVKALIETLKQGSSSSIQGVMDNGQFYTPLPPTIDHHHQNSFTNGGGDQLGGGADFHSVGDQNFYETASLEPMICYDMNPLHHYYGLPQELPYSCFDEDILQPLPQELPYSCFDEDITFENIFQYLMENGD